MYPYFEIAGRTVGSYAVLAIAGLLVCGFVVCRLGGRRGLAMEDLILAMLSLVGGMMVGGHLLYGITNLDMLPAAFEALGKGEWMSFFQQIGTMFGGMVYYGGFLGSVAAVAIHTHFAKDLDSRETMDLLAVGIPLFHVFGRVGCFFGGCCYGVESSWGFLITNNTLQPDINGVVRLPVQLIEAGCNLLIFLILLWLYHRRKTTGRLLAVYVALYAPTRFVLEFFRGDLIRGVWFGLSTSQWISLMLLVCVAVYALVIFRHKGADRPDPTQT